MDDFSFWWYIIAAVIYFLTRGKKKPQQPTSRPGSEDHPSPSQPKSFEDLLREITEGREEPQEASAPTQQPMHVDSEDRAKEDRRLEGERRAFADDESRRVYEESIKMAEVTDMSIGKEEEPYLEPRIFKVSKEEDEHTLADEIRDGLNSSEAKKAVIYSEILNRKY